MRELVIQALVFAAFLAIGHLIGWPFWGRALLAAGGLAVAHLVHERFFSRKRHLGAASISNDDPLMLAALDEARRTWPKFLELYPRYRKDSVVKFRLWTKSGEIENVWGDLLALEGDSVSVYLRTPPVQETEQTTRRLTVPLEDIVDWQIMFPDGSLRGGFTQRATFKIIERESGFLPKDLAFQLGRYRDLGAPGAEESEPEA